MNEPLTPIQRDYRRLHVPRGSRFARCHEYTVHSNLHSTGFLRRITVERAVGDKAQLAVYVNALIWQCDHDKLWLQSTVDTVAFVQAQEGCRPRAVRAFMRRSKWPVNSCQFTRNSTHTFSSKQGLL